MRSPLASTTIVVSVLLAACTGVPQPPAHGEPDASDTDADGDGDVDTGPEPTMTSIPGWELSWAVRAGGDEHDDPGSGGMFRETGYRIAPLEDGSVYLAGQVAEAAVFGQGEPNETHFPDVYANWSDAFIARYGAEGTLDWVRRIGGEGEDHVLGVAALDDGSAAIVGRFDSLQIVLGEGEPNETVFTAESSFNAYAARYSPDGQLIWATQIPKSEQIDTQMYAIDVHPLDDGRILVAGTFRGTAWPGESFEISSLPSETLGNNWDGYLAWLDADTGAAEGAVRIGNDRQWPNRISNSLPDGAVLVAAGYNGSETFGYGEQSETTLHCEDVFDWIEYCISLARYAADGRLEWVRDLGLRETSNTVLAALEDGDVSLISGFRAPWDPDGDGTAFTPHEEQGAVAVAKYSAESGALIWARTAYATPAGNQLTNLIAMPGSGLVAAFSFNDDLMEFEGNDAGQIALVPAGGYDIALVNFSASGDILWTHRLGGDGPDYVLGGAQLGGTTMWLTGAYGSDPFIASSGNGDDVSLPLSGYTDVFLMRFDSTAVPAD